MAKIKVGLEGRIDPDQRGGVKLSPRDTSDALRLINMLLNGPNSEHSAPANDINHDPPNLSVELSSKAKARMLFEQRRARSRHFAPSMFSESAWNMLLALYAVEDSERRMTITGLAELSGAPLTTALRWLDYLEQERLIQRVSSPTDRRVMFVHCAPLGREKLDAYLKGIDSLRL